MKKTITIAVLLLAFCGITFSQMLDDLRTPKDSSHWDGATKSSMAWDTNHPEWMPTQTEYQNLLRTRIHSLEYNDITNAFGPKLEKQPNDCVLPSFVPTFFFLSGLIVSNDQRHVDFYALGDVGSIQVFYGFDGKSIEYAAIYFRADEKFVPLSSDDYNAQRLEWEKAKLSLVEKWLDDHLPKMTDLGIFEVSTNIPSHPTYPKISKNISAPTPVDLGDGKVCLIQYDFIPNRTNYFLNLFLLLDTTNVVERRNSMVDEPQLNPGQPIVFKMAGKFYRLTPTLKEP